MSTENLGGQFRGWLNPATAGGVNRPERTGEGLVKPKGEDHVALIKAELANHPKTIGYKMFTEGLSTLGVSPNKKNLAHIAGLITSDNAKFHDLVRTARKNIIGTRDRVAAQRNQRRRGQ